MVVLVKMCHYSRYFLPIKFTLIYFAILPRKNKTRKLVERIQTLHEESLWISLLFYYFFFTIAIFQARQEKLQNSLSFLFPCFTPFLLFRLFRLFSTPFHDIRQSFVSHRSKLVPRRRKGKKVTTARAYRYVGKDDYISSFVWCFVLARGEARRARVRSQTD